GKFPLWNMENTIRNIKDAINLALSQNIPIIFIKHIADPAAGIAPFFNENTEGAEIIKELKDLSPEAEIVVKHYADSFEQTNLKKVLEKYKTTELLLCGMMTQNCVTHTAISREADNYNSVKILADCTTTTDIMIHNIALHAVSIRIPLVSFKEVL
ncbi:MAG: isochorismatase family protein, partial [Psittacicella sp.]